MTDIGFREHVKLQLADGILISCGHRDLITKSASARSQWLDAAGITSLGFRAVDRHRVL